MSLTVPFKKIRTYDIIVIFLIFPFFIPHSVVLLSQYNSIWETFYNVVAILRCGIAAVYVVRIIFKKHMHANLLVRCVVAYELSIFIACYINGSLTFQFAITNCLTYIGLACLLQFEDTKKGDRFLRGLIVLFGIFAIGGALSIILFPNGFNHASAKNQAIYFLGSKNNGFFYFSMYVFLRVQECFRKKRSFPTSLIVLTAVFVLCTIITNSVTGFLTMAMVFLFLILTKYKSALRKIFKPGFAVAIIVIFASMIPLLTSGELDWFFDLLGRESNFSMRTFIWDSALRLIYQNPWFGNGKDGDVILYKGQTQAHNIYLDYATKYGLITLAIFVLMLVVIAIKMAKTNKKEYLFTNSFFFFILFFHSLFDSVTMSFITLLLFYCQSESVTDADKALGRNRILASKLKSRSTLFN